MTDYFHSDADAPADDTGAFELPHDVSAERYVVGAMLRDGSVVDDVLDEMTITDLHVPKHEVIAESILRLASAGEPTGPIAVNDDLTKHGLMQQAGGPATVFELESYPSTASNAGFYARIVHNHAVRRRAIEGATRIMQAARSGDTDVTEVVEAARREVELIQTGRKKHLEMIWEGVDTTLEELAEKPDYLPTPWASIDRIIGGWAPGGFYVIAARPGAGKTLAVVQSAMKLAHTGVVAFSSIEMGKKELQKRLLANYGEVNQLMIRDHILGRQEWERMAGARSRLHGAPVWIDARGSVTVADIRASARAVARTGKLVAICVDYLQLVKGEGQDRRLEVDGVSRGLKLLAKELNVPVIVAAQLKRPAPQKGKQRALPTLADLRESGGIEQDADVVLLLERGIEEHARDLTVVAAKNRQGEEKQVTLRWEGEYARIVDRKWSPTALLDENEIRRQQ
ncbi:DnaB-like helicase C-terminal domain-containing protein [Herbiconiux sp. KACC 21604]|uniref:replicative DNA helicase n=1 Tax=unclassified Herbiconiux TaxID=2618217 RepID=UPI0014916E92|nr:DnaB-like helicase C-terminal domain-containing protein [Herbiconiux sp. SALV-R1]QJU54365.1 AAA family ATPase [Herbiconiux sp. SALV-R1]WPO85435.1 DnaB-like helicase C-terminal domain-containing protein [Herbiconiux sp. KACC 21604]